ncbi:LysR family transcriptional regulator [Uliginosibacterium sp. 31-12]|uniref:LysR family transcriptional regulator n=1 Tax=Uliginosibacterium sp. 31-12 TaxID=3062781 RepID=UPI0026E46F6E|nr:LysR family transcriptional regulator [Uliginosibacterium sp. 31-12]MDO6387130.1 LysR family transcriptional regulator [Uliginosibacterium sp. 31-12]
MRALKHFSELQTFLAVAELGSFSAAAKRLGLARSTVSTQVQALERALGLALFHRTTRHVSLTADGERYAARAGVLVSGLEELTAEFSQRAGRVAGRLHVQMTESIANTLVLPRMAEFLRAYPDLALRISLSERAPDLAAEGIDVALRLSDNKDSAYRYKRFGQVSFVMAASPAYLARFGVPRHPNDLLRHQTIDFFDADAGRAIDYVLVKGREEISVTADGDLAVDNARAGLTCALAGLGIYEDFDFLLRPHLQEGKLVRVLPDWRRPGPAVLALYPGGHQNSAPVRAFLKFLDMVLSPALKGGGVA